MGAQPGSEMADMAGMRIIGAAVATVLIAVASAVPANADPPTFDAGAGLPTVGNFNDVTLNGTQQLASATVAPFVIDGDPGLAGWQVTLTVADFRNGTGAGCAVGATASISGANVSMNAPVVTAAAGTTSMTGVTSAGFTDFTSPRTVIDAAAGAGAGTYDVAPENLRLIIPADVLAGAYCSAATIAITSGP